MQECDTIRNRKGEGNADLPHQDGCHVGIMCSHQDLGRNHSDDFSKLHTVGYKRKNSYWLLFSVSGGLAALIPHFAVPADDPCSGVRSVGTNASTEGGQILLQLTHGDFKDFEPQANG